MLVLGLTGGIACGKSNVSSALRELGAEIIDGDVLSRELTAPGGEALPGIRAAFGPGVFHPDGTLDRRALGAAIFGDAEKRARLDALMQPMILRRIREELERLERAGTEIAVLDMPLLYEVGLDKLCQRVWCVTLPRETQLARLMERDHFTREEAESRLRSQMDPAEKARRADVVIDTSGSIRYTRDSIPPLLAEERRLAALQRSNHGTDYPRAPQAR